MNGRFKRASALLATVALLSGGVIAALATPASASTQTGCESYFNCETQFSGTGTPEINGPFQLGQAFSVSEPGVAGYFCYPNASPNDINDSMSLYDETTSTVVVSGTATSFGTISCVFAGATLTPGDVYVASYSDTTDYFQNTGGGFGTDGDVTGLGGRYGSAGNPDPTSTGFSFGLRVDFQSFANAPDISLVQSGFSSVTAAFTGDGFPGATFSMTCTSSAIGALGTFTTSPVQLTGLPNVVNQTISCSATETVPSFLTLAGLTGVGTLLLPGISGPGCAGTVVAPTNLSTASEAFPGAVVSWAPVTADPSSCLVGYVVTPFQGSAALPSTLVPGHGTTTVVQGLTEGSTYTFTVAALTGSGVGPASSATAPVTIGTPAAATAVKVSKAGKGAIKVAFKAGNNNGAAITGFAVTCGPRTVLSHSSPTTVKGLASGKSVTCTVKAANSRGTGARSARSARINP